MADAADQHRQQRPGGLGASKPADEEVQQAVKAVQSAIASQANADANSQLTPISYGTQVVAGKNYFVKIRIGADPNAKYVHARIYKNLQGHYELSGIEENHTATDEIGYFERH
ncbi:cystatin-A2-like isoform X2 [Paramacrobiotus metropolitanus]|nr:cystatin-A2-like isoform X2 [Paramacrobiotus metropolitanus]